jgi:hypothetical protein
VLATSLSSGACGPDVAADDTQGGEGPVDETADPWQLCDAATIPEPPADAGPCPGGVPAGALVGEAAGWIFGRAMHEIDHIGEVVYPGVEDPGLFEIDGDELRALSDSGYVVGRIAREGGTGRACVRVAFACWTGGHGGFGPSGLDGRAEVLVDDETVEARGELGLVEGGALSGAPSAEVWVRIEGASVEGSVGEFAF